MVFLEAEEERGLADEKRGFLAQTRLADTGMIPLHGAEGGSGGSYTVVQTIIHKNHSAGCKTSRTRSIPIPSGAAPKRSVQRNNGIYHRKHPSFTRNKLFRFQTETYGTTPISCAHWRTTGIYILWLSRESTYFQTLIHSNLVTGSKNHRTH